MEKTAILDTAATSIWLDYSWFINRDGVVEYDEEGVTAADGRALNVKGHGQLTFELWGCQWTEAVRLLSNLPHTMLLGKRFMKKHQFKIDMPHNKVSMVVHGLRYEGPIGVAVYHQSEEKVEKSIEDSEVNNCIGNDMDMSEFSTCEQRKSAMREVKWQKRAIFKGFPTIKGIVHTIKLNESAEPVCFPQRRRYPKEENIERACMNRLLEMGVMETGVSPWAANNVFVPKKRHRDVRNNGY